MSKPGRDPRDEMPKQILRADVLKVEDLRDGMVLTGTVRNVTDFGAFVELETGVDALLHVSQIALEHVDKPSDVLKIGQEIEAKVVDLNVEEKKISLSIKALLKDNASDEAAEEVSEEN